jgi:hypothetical protein
MAMMEKDKNKRPSTLAEAMRRLEEAAAAAGVVVPATSTTGDPAATPPIPHGAMASSGDGTEATLASGDRVPVSMFPSTVASQGRVDRARIGMLGVLAVFVIAAFFPARHFLGEMFSSSEEPSVRDAMSVDRAEKPEPVDPKPVEMKPEEPKPPPEPVMVNLSVKTKMKGLQVFQADDVLLCKAPCVIPFAKGTRVVLELRAEGHVTEHREVIADSDHAIEVALKKKPSRASKQTKKPGSDDLEYPTF